MVGMGPTALRQLVMGWAAVGEWQRRLASFLCEPSGPHDKFLLKVMVKDKAEYRALHRGRALHVRLLPGVLIVRGSHVSRRWRRPQGARRRRWRGQETEGQAEQLIYPPIFRAKPGESYRDWRRSLDFWLGGEGHQIPKEYIGPRIMVQLRDRAAQLVKHLNNADVNTPDGMQKIFHVLERSPLVKQLDKHRVDQHRKRLMALRRCPNESLESYITRGNIYRNQLLGLDSSLEMGERFYVGHLLDHARLTRRDKALVRTRAGEDTEEAVTNALVELAAELEGEPGCPIGASEPNVAGAMVRSGWCSVLEVKAATWGRSSTARQRLVQRLRATLARRMSSTRRRMSLGRRVWMAICRLSWLCTIERSRRWLRSRSSGSTTRRITVMSDVGHWPRRSGPQPATIVARLDIGAGSAPRPWRHIRPVWRPRRSAGRWWRKHHHPWRAFPSSPLVNKTMSGIFWYHFVHRMSMRTHRERPHECIWLVRAEWACMRMRRMRSCGVFKNYKMQLSWIWVVSSRLRVQSGSTSCCNAGRRPIGGSRSTRRKKLFVLEVETPCLVDLQFICWQLSAASPPF